MDRYKPAFDLMTILIEARQYATAASVELAFKDSFEACADAMALEIINSARSGNTNELKNVVKDTSDEIAFHLRWEEHVWQLLAAEEHHQRDSDCLRQALMQTKSVRQLLIRQVHAVTTSLMVAA